jgi:hypothetical protein
MKKSRHVQLVLITALLASCHSAKEPEWSEGDKKVYLRSDSTAPYTRTHHSFTSGLMWYYAFRSFGMMNGNGYARGGYHSDALAPQSNFGSNAFKSQVARGGFGRSSFRTGS